MQFTANVAMTELPLVIGNQFTHKASPVAILLLIGDRKRDWDGYESAQAAHAALTPTDHVGTERGLAAVPHIAVYNINQGLIILEIDTTGELQYGAVPATCLPVYLSTVLTHESLIYDVLEMDEETWWYDALQAELSRSTDEEPSVE